MGRHDFAMSENLLYLVSLTLQLRMLDMLPQVSGVNVT